MIRLENVAYLEFANTLRYVIGDISRWLYANSLSTNLLIDLMCIFGHSKQLFNFFNNNLTECRW